MLEQLLLREIMVDGFKQFALSIVWWLIKIPPKAKQDQPANAARILLTTVASSWQFHQAFLCFSIANVGPFSCNSPIGFYRSYHLQERLLSDNSLP